MRASLVPALLLAAALAPSPVAAQRRRASCSRANDPYCYGYLFVGDGRRRTPVVVDGVSVGPTPVLLLLPHRQRHTVSVGATHHPVVLRPSEIVELELDPATARERAAGDEAVRSGLRTYAPLGFASAADRDPCGGILSPAPLRLRGPVNVFVATDLWRQLPAGQAVRVIPRPEEVIASDAAACMRGDADACETAALAHWNFAGRLPGVSDARATELFAHACDSLHSERACHFLQHTPTPAPAPALQPR